MRGSRLPHHHYGGSLANQHALVYPFPAGHLWIRRGVGHAARRALAWYLLSPLVVTHAADALPPAATERRRVVAGGFGTVDRIHQGSGFVRVIQVGDGQRLLRQDNA